MPISPRQEIIPEFSYAWLAREQIAQGHLLADWSPYEWAGFPWLRYIPFPLYYGLGGLSLLSGLSLEWLFRLGFWAVFTLAGGAAFEWVRRLSDSNLGGLVAGLVYALIPAHSHITVEVFTHAVAWALAPLPFLAYERVRQQRRPTRWLGWGALLALLPVVSIEYAMLLTPFLALYLLWREAEGLRAREWPWQARLAPFAAAGLAALALAGFVVLPGLLETSLVGIHAKHASGADLHLDLLRAYSAPPQALLATLLRRLRVTLPLELPAVYRSYQASTWYLGWTVLALAAWGLLRPPRRGLGWLLGLCAVLGVLRAAGPWLPGNFFLLLPVIGKLTPFRSLGLLALVLATLAGFGGAALGRAAPAGRARWLVGGLVFLLPLVELYGPSAAAFVSRPAYFSADEQEAYAWVQGQEGDFRVWELPQDHRDEYLFTYSLAHLPRPRFGGYFDNGAPLHMWGLAMEATYPPGEVHALTVPALRLYGTRYVLLRQDRRNYAAAAEALQAAGYRMAFGNEATTVLEDPQALPLARWWGAAVLFWGDDDLAVLGPCLEHGVLPVHEEASSLDDWSSAELDRFALVEVGQASVACAQARGSSGAAADLRWERPGPQEIRVTARTAADGWLEVAEAWYPHWQATVDGEPVRLLRTNVAFQGVWLPAGEHQVVFTYRWPAILWASWALSGLAALAVGGLWVWGRLSKKEGL
ncbi:MAG: hypothetical protein GX605_05065 [Chloroflexi bacterium]|nr:hypothetical protein [Chloroflexota bacterium]